MASVVVVNRNPIEFCPEVMLHLGHETAGQCLAIGFIHGVFRRDDEEELMTVSIGAVEELSAVAPILSGVVEIARHPFSRHAIPLQITKVSLSTLQFETRQPD